MIIVEHKVSEVGDRPPPTHSILSLETSGVCGFVRQLCNLNPPVLNSNHQKGQKILTQWVQVYKPHSIDV